MNNLFYLLPVIIITVASILILLLIIIRRMYLLTATLTSLAFLAAGISTFFVHSLPVDITDLMIYDRFGQFFILLILLAGFLISIISYRYFKNLKKRREEYFVILLLGSAGASVMVLSNHFISFFLGLELLSVSLYILIAYTKTRKFAIEAGIKYLLLAGVSSAFLLMGMALIFAETGAMNFTDLMQKIGQSDNNNLLLTAGLGLVITGAGFKMAIVPFHLWTPDVYEGSPSPSTAFIASVSKVSIVVVLTRLYLGFSSPDYTSIVVVFSVLSVLSMFIGNLLALLQKNIKRILAYSSISHLGYVLVALVAGKIYGLEAIMFYLFMYLITIIGAFGILTAISDHEEKKMEVSDFRGYFWTRPGLAAAFSVFLFSLAGIPLTAGFIGKYYLLISGVYNNSWFLVSALIISSVIGLYYYLRIIVEMFRPKDEESAKESIASVISPENGIVIAVIGGFIILFGIYPAWITQIIESVVSAFY